MGPSAPSLGDDLVTGPREVGSAPASWRARAFQTERIGFGWPIAWRVLRCAPIKISLGGLALPWRNTGVEKVHLARQVHSLTPRKCRSATLGGLPVRAVNRAGSPRGAKACNRKA